MTDQSTASALPSAVPPLHPWVQAGQGRIRFGLGGGPAWPDLAALARLAAELGFDSLWLTDHPARNKADCWTLLAALAVTTERLRLGTLVSAVPYRLPTLLARMAADVDRLSGGRLVLGLGIGWDATEFGQLGLPLPPASARQAALAEAVTIIRGLWSGEMFSFTGQHYQVSAARLPAPPVQQPRVPLLIAGGGERVTLRQVTQCADMANFGATATMGGAFTVADIRRKLDTLRRHCAALGRPYESIIRSNTALGVVLAPTEAALQAKLERLLAHVSRERLESLRPSMVTGTPAQVIAFYQTLADAGLQYFIAGVLPDEETVRLLGEHVLPAVRAPAVGS